jgi:hypothetical protein
MSDQSSDAESRFPALLGLAVQHVWADLPQDAQKQIFEHAVVIGHQGERDESLRERLAQFLHDRHKRTKQES